MIAEKATERPLMLPLTRYDQFRTKGQFDKMVEYPDGQWCKAADVAALEAQYAELKANSKEYIQRTDAGMDSLAAKNEELEARLAQLQEAAEEVFGSVEKDWIIFVPPVQVATDSMMEKLSLDRNKLAAFLSVLAEGRTDE